MNPRPLYPGPDIDGRPTWLCQMQHIPAGYECRWTTSQAWRPAAEVNPPLAGDEGRWVQIRRPRPSPSDHVLVADAGGVLFPIRFAEVCETVVGAMASYPYIPGEDFAEVEHSVALAVWQLLVEGRVPGDG